ncbi:MAG: hypothetical protein H7255_16470 [Ramlibacter sp.]|nr:hypothetical protein [Ramlibacter sp.]
MAFLGIEKAAVFRELGYGIFARRYQRVSQRSADGARLEKTAFRCIKISFFYLASTPMMKHKMLEPLLPVQPAQLKSLGKKIIGLRTQISVLGRCRQVVQQPRGFLEHLRLARASGTQPKPIESASDSQRAAVSNATRLPSQSMSCFGSPPQAAVSSSRRAMAILPSSASWFAGV